MLEKQQDQHDEDFETKETQYSTNVHNVVSMLTSLIRHQVKDYHHDLIYICLKIHPDFLQAFVWRHERRFLYYL